MTTKSLQTEVDLVDAFLRERKQLHGAPPEFGEKKRGGATRRIWEAAWPISDSVGVVAGGELRLNLSPASDKPFSLSVIYRDNCIYRLDYVDKTISHLNPVWAAKLNVEPRVFGPHVHDWFMNRQHILETGNWNLDCRMPIPDEIEDYQLALPWLAEKINLTLGPTSRSFALPEVLF